MRNRAKGKVNHTVAEFGPGLETFTDVNPKSVSIVSSRGVKYSVRRAARDPKCHVILKWPQTLVLERNATRLAHAGQTYGRVVQPRQPFRFFHRIEILHGAFDDTGPEVAWSVSLQGEV